MATLYVPEDLLLNVLLRLPAKTLLGFRRVSKSWQSLIGSRYFTKMHLYRLENNTSNSKIVICHHSGGTSKLYAMDCITAAGITSAAELHYPPLKYHEKSEIELLGSSNGVLCLKYAYQKIILWNPLSQMYHEVSRLKISGKSSFQSERSWTYGFGYDKITGDYTVLLLVGFCDKRGSPVSCEGWSYSLKLKRWKRLEIFSYTRWLLRQNGVLFNGSLHWISSDNLIVAFNLADEKFSILPKPNYSHGFDIQNVGILDGCLYLSCKYRTRYIFETWVMKEYGIKESWTRINLELPNEYDSLRPIAYLNNKKQLIFDYRGELIVHDLEKKSVESVLSYCNYFQIHPYIETFECYDGTSNEIERDSHKHKRTHRTESNDTSTSMDTKSGHHWKRIKL